VLTPHASLPRRRFFEPPAQYGDTNEGVRGEYSGSWLAFFPAFTAGVLPGDWRQIGKLYPVTAARLLPVFTEFLASTRIMLNLAKNWEDYGRKQGGCQGGRSRRDAEGCRTDFFHRCGAWTHWAPPGGFRPRLLSGRPAGPNDAFGIYMNPYIFSKGRKKSVVRLMRSLPPHGSMIDSSRRPMVATLARRAAM